MPYSQMKILKFRGANGLREKRKEEERQKGLQSTGGILSS
jgi:hypothetical protein